MIKIKNNLQPMFASLFRLSYILNKIRRDYNLRNRVREVRIMKNITQAKLVENISVTRQYISLIELEEETPSFKVANEIANVLGVCMHKIFDLDGTCKYRYPSCNQL